MQSFDHPDQLAILHADMDAFFANVEIMDNPQLKGKPVIVGGDPKSRSVVATCSYEARKYGVHSAMSVQKAKKLCPNGIFVFPRMERYVEVSNKVFEIIESFTPDYEPLSIDEAFLDMKGTEQIFGHPIIAALKLKQQIRQKTGITVSIGVAHNKFLAKLASDENKPDGLFILTPNTFQEYLDKLPIDKMWGVGKVTTPVMLKNNIKTIQDLRKFPEDRLKKIFGNQWSHYYNLSRGIDDRKVENKSFAKSIGKEITFEIDLTDKERMHTEIWNLSELVSRRLNRERIRGKTITLKVKTSTFILLTRSKSMLQPVHIDIDIYKIACELLEKVDLTHIKVRLLGVSVSNFNFNQEDPQLLLFDNKKENLNEAVNKIKDKFGEELITRGIGIKNQISFP